MMQSLAHYTETRLPFDRFEPKKERMPRTDLGLGARRHSSAKKRLWHWTFSDSPSWFLKSSNEIEYYVVSWKSAIVIRMLGWGSGDKAIDDTDVPAFFSFSGRVHEISERELRIGPAWKRDQAAADESRDDKAATFANFVRQWTKDTLVLSSPTQKVSHPAYLSIIAMGESALPYIYEALKEHGGFWYPALEAITQHKPQQVPPARGRMRAARQYWLKWLEENQYARATQHVP